MPPVVVVSVLFVSSSVTRMFLRPVPWPPLAPSMDGGRGTFEKRTDRPNLDYIYIASYAPFFSSLVVALPSSSRRPQVS